MSKQPMNNSNQSQLERFCQTKEDKSLENYLQDVPSEELDVYPEYTYEASVKHKAIEACDSRADAQCLCYEDSSKYESTANVECAESKPPPNAKAKVKAQSTNANNNLCSATQTQKKQPIKLDSVAQCDALETNKGTSNTPSVPCKSTPTQRHAVECSKIQNNAPVPPCNAIQKKDFKHHSTLPVIHHSQTPSCTAFPEVMSEMDDSSVLSSYCSKQPSVVNSEVEFSCLATSDGSIESFCKKLCPQSMLSPNVDCRFSDVFHISSQRESQCGITCPSLPKIAQCPKNSCRSLAKLPPPKVVPSLGPPRVVPAIGPPRIVPAIGPPRVVPALEPPKIAKTSKNTLAVVPYKAEKSPETEPPARYKSLSASRISECNEVSINKRSASEGEYPCQTLALVPVQAQPQRSPVQKNVKSKSDTQVISSSSRYKNELPQKAFSTTLVRVGPVQNLIDLSVLRAESRESFQQNLTYTLKSGISGLKEFISERSIARLNKKKNERKDLIDYFIDCDGLRYVGLLEQIQLDFEERCKALLLSAHPNSGNPAAQLRMQLAEIPEVQPVYQEKVLLDFDFPTLLEKEIKILNIDYKPKFECIRQLHEYGNDMAKYWFTQINEGKSVDPNEVYDVGSQMMAELLGQIFSLLVKCCQFLIGLSTEPSKKNRKFTLDLLIQLFNSFRRLVTEEIGAIGETCGQVMVRIPKLAQDRVVSIMSELYRQVNFADTCTSRALLPIIPLILFYDFHYKK